MNGVAHRIVTHTRTNKYGEVTHICNPTMSWKEVKVEEAISQISSMMYSYAIKYKDTYVPIKVVKDNQTGKKFLVSEDETLVTLDKLPGLY